MSESKVIFHNCNSRITEENGAGRKTWIASKWEAFALKNSQCMLWQKHAVL